MTTDTLPDRIDRLGDLARHPSVHRALEIVREILDVDVSYIALDAGAEQVLEAFSGDGTPFGVGQGTRMPMEATYCHRILAGDLPNVIPDVRANPVAAAVPVTDVAGVGAFASVPVTMSDGRHYGTLCCGSREAQPQLGARDAQYLHLLARIVADQVEREEVERRRVRDRLESAGVEALLAAVAARDGYTGEHSNAVVEHAVAVARELGLDERAVTDVEHVARLHDVGKLGTPDRVLHKPGKLDDEEWEVMREHPVVGAQIVSGLPGLDRLTAMVRAEHERWDGGGYPDGLAGEAIPIASRITLVCDAYHAMTSDRPYRRALGHHAALAELRRHAGSQFCARSVDGLIAVLEPAHTMPLAA